MHALRDHLKEWTDIDIAMAALGAALGLYPDNGRPFFGVKWVFWTNNPAGNMLHRMLDELVAIGALEVSEDGERYRWRDGFDIHQIT